MKWGQVGAAALSAALVIFALAGVANASTITLGFPSVASTSSQSGNDTFGAGNGSIAHFLTGTLTETFIGTGLPSATSSEWIFSMTDFTSSGIVNDFDLLINGIVVDSFNFTGNGTTQTHSFDLTFSFAPIVGDTFTLSMMATSTVPITQGTWDWNTGGDVILAGPSPTPLPGAFPLFTGGLGVLGFLG